MALNDLHSSGLEFGSRRGRRIRRLSLLVVLAALLAGTALTASASAASETAWSWGDNNVGILGYGTTSGPQTCVGAPCAQVPNTVNGLPGAAGIAAGANQSLELLQNGTVMAWGYNAYGQLGDGTSTGPSTCPGKRPCSTTPVAVSGLSHVVAVAAGANFSLALRSNGRVMAWGRNDVGQLGDGTSSGPSLCGKTPCSTTPVAVSGLTNVVAIAAGENHALALLSNGQVMAWGGNGSGQLGDLKSGGPNTTPVTVATFTGGPLTGVTAIAAGSGFSLALLSNGQVDAWGYNGLGELGQGNSTGPSTCSTMACSTAPVTVSGLSGVTAIAANDQAFQALALVSGGTVMAWGDNGAGQLGDGTSAGPNSCSSAVACATTPVAVSGLSGVTAIATNLQHSMAVLSGGSVMSWGDNTWGQLGDDSTTSSTTPVVATGLSGAVAIATGADHSLAIAPPLSNKFHINPVLFCRFCQFVTIKITAPDPGLLTAAQLARLSHVQILASAAKTHKPLIKPVTVQVTKAGTVTIKLRLTAAGKKALKRSRKLKIKVLITFSPRDGTPASQTVTVTFRQKKKKHH